MAKRWGIWGARADRGGLATITTELAAHLHPAKVMGIDLGQAGRGPCDWSQYQTTLASEDGSYSLSVHAGWGPLTVHRGLDNFDRAEVHEWLDGLDLVWFTEIDYCSGMVLHSARALGIATVLQVMPELHQSDHPADVLVNPTPWRHHLLPDHAVVLPVPVPLDLFTYRQRSEAATFFHLAAPAFRDRNGTELVLAALPHVTEPCRFVIREDPARPLHLPSVVGVVEVSIDRRDVAHWSATIPDEADVLVLPRRFGGLSLPMLEAAAQGIPVLSLDVAPQNEWLAGPQCPTTGRQAAPMQGGIVDVWQADPWVLAQTIDAWARSPEVGDWSAAVREYAQRNSWDALKGDYLDLIETASERKASA